MDRIASALKSLKKNYDIGGSPLSDIGKLAGASLAMLETKARFVPFPVETSGQKTYHVFVSGTDFSRPILPLLMINDSATFLAEWSDLTKAIRPDDRKIDFPVERINRILGTAIGGFCACYDLWKPRSRKTPGTFFEILIGSLVGRILPGWRRTKFIPIPGEAESVSTDIVFTNLRDDIAFVLPVKTTTRERVVQPFAHQRILNSVFGEGHYRSYLLCVSELQRDEDQTANEICVPGTIKLFQKHLAKLSGIFYLDPPSRYLQPDVTGVIPVKTVGEFFAIELNKITAQPNPSAPH